jgi:hypothetical protein
MVDYLQLIRGVGSSSYSRQLRYITRSECQWKLVMVYIWESNTKRCVLLTGMKWETVDENTGRSKVFGLFDTIRIVVGVVEDNIISNGQSGHYLLCVSQLWFFQVETEKCKNLMVFLLEMSLKQVWEPRMGERGRKTGYTNWSRTKSQILTKSGTRLAGCHAFAQMVDHHFQSVSSAHIFFWLTTVLYNHSII